MHEVNEGISHIALILEVDGQVEEVVVHSVLLIDQVQQHRLRVLVWNVLYHYCGSGVQAKAHLVEVDFEVHWGM